MRPSPNPRPALLALAASLMLVPMTGCPAEDNFYGRFIVLNRTGKTVRSIALEIPDVNPDVKFALPELGAGQSWLKKPDGFTLVRNLRVSWIDGSGTARQGSLSLVDLIPPRCEDDFFIELQPEGRMETYLSRRAELLERKLIELRWLAAIWGIFCLVVGWVLGRRSAIRAARQRETEKSSIVDI